MPEQPVADETAANEDAAGSGPKRRARIWIPLALLALFVWRAAASHSLLAAAIQVAPLAAIALLVSRSRRGSDDADADVPEPEPAEPAPAFGTVVDGDVSEGDGRPFPAAAESQAIAQRLLEACSHLGRTLAVHLWFSEASSRNLRPVAAVGSMVPPWQPIAAGDDPLSVAAEDLTARVTPIASIELEGTHSTLWRFAAPLDLGTARAVIGIDIAAEAVPDVAGLAEATSPFRESVERVLALHVARADATSTRMLLHAAGRLSGGLSRDEIAEEALAQAVAISRATVASVMLGDEEGHLRIVASYGLPEEVVAETRLRTGEGIAGWVRLTGEPILIEDRPGMGGRNEDVRTAISAPITDGSTVFGVLNVSGPLYPSNLSARQVDALRVLGRQVGVALHGAEALSSARELYFEALRALALALETKDPYGLGGTDRVLGCATALAREFALDESEMRALRLAAVLHDIGMKPTGDRDAADLSAFELALLDSHPARAVDMLEETPALRAAIPIVYHHHEWFDGRGYVAGLAGTEIPFGARILSVADAFTAMTSERPYRVKMTAEEALAEIRRKAGTQFDPAVVDALGRIVEADVA